MPLSLKEAKELVTLLGAPGWNVLSRTLVATKDFKCLSDGDATDSLLGFKQRTRAGHGAGVDDFLRGDFF